METKIGVSTPILSLASITSVPLHELMTLRYHKELILFPS